MSDPARKAYDEAMAAARKAYDEAMAAAHKAYDEAMAPAPRRTTRHAAAARRTTRQWQPPTRRTTRQWPPPARRTTKQWQPPARRTTKQWQPPTRLRNDGEPTALELAQAELSEAMTPWPDEFMNDYSPQAGLLFARQVSMCLLKMVTDAAASLGADGEEPTFPEVLNGVAAMVPARPTRW